MFHSFFQGAAREHSLMWMIRHLGAFGLFLLTILDSSPIPTFGGADVLVVVLASTRRLPWYAYAIIATSGSLLGAHFTFRLARKAGEAYLDNKFGRTRVTRFLKIFKRWGTGSLAASTAIPFPFPTSLFFAAAGASDYSWGKFLTVVAICRGIRYGTLALVADLYGRSLIGVLRHPTRYWGWLLLSAAVFVILIAGGFFLNKRVTNATTAQ